MSKCMMFSLGAVEKAAKRQNHSEYRTTYQKTRGAKKTGAGANHANESKPFKWMKVSPGPD